VLAGGVALGAYQAGAYAALHEHEELWPARLAGSSIGAVNAALIAGNAPQMRLAQLQAFWNEAHVDNAPLLDWLGGSWRDATSWLSVLQSRLFGRSGQFRPRFAEMMLSSVSSVYDLAPLRAQIEKLVDFERLNAGEPRLTVVTTDIETGDEVAFDTCNGASISADHLIASCGFLPDFPPIEIGGRLLGDGGLVANAPVETALLDEDSNADILCFVVDLFSSRGERPRTLEQAAARRWDLLFGNQTRQTLNRLKREYRHRARHPKVTIVHLAYRPSTQEAGPEKPFDFSRQTLTERWEAGYLDMQEGILLASGSAISSVRGVSLDLW
jgi:NTE family protein